MLMVLELCSKYLSFSLPLQGIAARTPAVTREYSRELSLENRYLSIHFVTKKDNNFMKLLHILATPRKSSSNTLKVSQVLIESLSESIPALKVETLDLFHHELAATTGDNIEAKYLLSMGLSIKPSMKLAWMDIEKEISRFMASDIILISSPMWNFSIPYALKYYIDTIVQPGYLYKYNEQGVPIGLVHGKKLICITSRGGDYSQAPMNALDFQEPYLRAIFGFVGVRDIQFVNCQPMDISQALREEALTKAIEMVKSIAKSQAAGV